MPKPKIPDDISEIFRTDPIAYELGTSDEVDRLNEAMAQSVALMDECFVMLVRTVAKSKEVAPGVIVSELDFGPVKFQVAMKIDEDGVIEAWHCTIERYGNSVGED